MRLCEDLGRRSPDLLVTSAMSVEAMQAGTHATYVPSLSRDLLISLKGVGVIQESTCVIW